MAYAPAALDTDRLPWLKDERAPARSGDMRPLVLWSIVAALLIAGVSFWIGKMAPTGVTTGLEPPATATVNLPDPLPSQPARKDVAPAVMPQVKPVREPPAVSISTPRRDRSTRSRAKKRAVLAREPLPEDNLREIVGKQAVAKPEATRAPARQELWPASESQDAYGRVVRIGTFATRYQAKRAWHRVMRAYPGMRRLKAVVVGNPSERNGRTYYRLQFGTSSQAHSTVLCQRMRTIGQSCVVVGLPGGVA